MSFPMSLLARFFKLREENDVVKPFLHHLEDLRWMLMKMGAAVVCCMIGSFFLRHHLVYLVQKPLADIDPDMVRRLQTLGVADSLMISLQLAFYAGIIASFPLLLFFLVQFVLPALSKKEKKLVFPAIAIGTFLFISGVLLCYYFVLPGTLKFFAEDAKSLDWTPSWTVRDYFSFVTHMTLIFGLAFELPVLVMSLVALGFISYDFMASTRRYAIVIILVIAALIAPTPDPLTFLSMGIPMCMLYEVCIWIAWFIERRRKTKLEEPLEPV